MKPLRKVLLAGGIFVGLSIVFMAASFLYVADIRPEGVVTSGESEKRARAVLARAAEAHGLDTLRQHQTLELAGSDEWLGIMGALSNPFRESQQGFRLKAEIHRTNTRLELSDGPEAGAAWVVHEDRSTYFASDGAALAPRSPRALDPMLPATFLLPTYRYFAVAAFELPTAEIVGYVGERSVEGRPQDVVYATWGDEHAHTGADQYLVFVDKETGRISRLEYTIREMMPSAMGRANYVSYGDVNGVGMPTQIDIVGLFPGGGSTLIHVMRFDEARLDTVEISTLNRRN